MHPRCTLAAGALALIAAFPTLAADKADEAIVVTATRQPQRANELLADVSVLTRDDIEKAGQSTLTELLGRQPGIEFSSSGGPGSPQSLFIRGTNSEHTMVLIDGQRINSATLGSTSLSRIPLEQIERIEVLRGPASSLYGSDALGGVVQIFTRKGDGPARANAEIAYGSYNTSKVSAGVSGGQEGLRYSLQAAYDETDGFSNISDRKSSAYNADRDGFRNKSLSGSLGYRFNPDHEAGINFLNSSGRNKYDSGFNAAAAAKDYRNDLWISSVSAFLRDRFLPNWTSTLRVGRGIDDSESLSNNTLISAVRTTQDQYAWQNDIKLPLGTMLLAAERLEQKINATSNYDKTRRTIDSLMAGWGASAGNHRWQLNLRNDDISGTGNKNTGSASYGYQFSETWRGSVAYGTAYKAPSMNDLYYPNTPFVGRGNPNLKPEFARNREAAIHYETQRHSASLTLFHNRIDDLIQWAETPPGSWFYVPQNVASARIQGATLAYNGRFDALTLRGNANFLDARDTATDNWLPRRARQFGMIGADYDGGKWTLGSEIVALGRRFSDTGNTQSLGGYTLVNLSASYRLDKDLSLFARINNLFDKKYELVEDYGVPGTNILVGLRYQPK